MAKALGFARGRVTQIMDLLLLAPEIQEEILFLMKLAGRQSPSERDLRRVLRASGWAEQRRRRASAHAAPQPAVPQPSREAQQFQRVGRRPRLLSGAGGCLSRIAAW